MGEINIYNIKIIIYGYRISDVIIPISMALNDEYTYPTIVAITSILKMQIQILNIFFIYYIYIIFIWK